MAKRLLISTFVLLTGIAVFQFPALAQEQSSEKGPEFIGHFGISGSPYIAGTYFSPRSWSSENYASYGTLESIYSDRSDAVNTTGTFVAGLDIKFNRTVAVSVDLGLNAMWSDTYSNITGDKTGTDTGIAVYLIPKVKIYYMDRPWVRMYGTAGFGVGRYFGYTRRAIIFKNPFKFEAQFVPFGLEVGKKLFGFAELGAGSLFMGIHVGAGYKF